MLSRKGEFDASNEPLRKYPHSIHSIVKAMREMERLVFSKTITKKQAIENFNKWHVALAPLIEHDVVQDYTENKQKFATWASQIQRRLKLKINAMVSAPGRIPARQKLNGVCTRRPPARQKLNGVCPWADSCAPKTQ